MTFAIRTTAVALLFAGAVASCNSDSSDVREAAREAVQSAENATVTGAANTAAVLNESADEAVASGPTTSIEFVETEYDFGTITEGEEVVHTYTFTNTGSEPLLFTDARGSCGCTVPDWPRNPIAPGGTGEVVVKFNSKGKGGDQNRKVTLQGNTDPAQTFLTLTGKVNKADAES